MAYDAHSAELAAAFAHRARRLRLWIDQHYEGNVSSFARSVGKAPSHVHMELKGRRAFGERLARDLERRANMPALWLDRE